jgi:hypothetical protein
VLVVTPEARPLRPPGSPTASAGSRFSASPDGATVAAAALTMSGPRTGDAVVALSQRAFLAAAEPRGSA